MFEGLWSLSVSELIIVIIFLAGVIVSMMGFIFTSLTSLHAGSRFRVYLGYLLAFLFVVTLVALVVDAKSNLLIFALICFCIVVIIDVTQVYYFAKNFILSDLLGN